MNQLHVVPGTFPSDPRSDAALAWIRIAQIQCKTAQIVLLVTIGLFPGSPAAQAPTLGTPAISRSSDDDRYVEILRRPLFEPERRPPLAERASAPKVESAVPTDPVERKTQPLEIELLGVVMSSGVAKALVRLLHERKSRVVEPGETLNDWRISTIEPEAIELRNAEEIQKVEIQRRGAIGQRPGRHAASNQRPPPAAELLDPEIAPNDPSE